jgi:hypothetical protein
MRTSKKAQLLSQWLLDNVFFSTSEQPPTLPAPVEGLSYADMAAAWSLATWQCTYTSIMCDLDEEKKAAAAKSSH